MILSYFVLLLKYQIIFITCVGINLVISKKTSEEKKEIRKSLYNEKYKNNTQISIFSIYVCHYLLTLYLVINL